MMAKWKKVEEALEEDDRREQDPTQNEQRRLERWRLRQLQKFVLPSPQILLAARRLLTRVSPTRPLMHIWLSTQGNSRQREYLVKQTEAFVVTKH